MKLSVFLFTLAVFLQSATVAVAQAIPVRGGDHDTFTRLVVRVGANRMWQIDREGASVLIAFSPANIALDISNSFDLIQRNRLAEIALVQEGLELRLACDCEIEARRYNENYLVIDIFDQAPEMAPAEMQDTAPVALPVVFEARTDPRPSLDLQISHAETGPLGATADPPAQAPVDELLQQSAVHLAEQLARATAAGLLEAAPGQPLAAAGPIILPAPRAEASEMPEVDGSDVQDAGSPMMTLPPFPVHAATAFDLNHPQFSAAPSLPSCLAPPARSMSEWSNGHEFSHGLGVLRTALYDDRGRIIERQARALAEFYLYHGLGAEALFWLQNLDRAEAFSLSLADYFENGPAEQFGRFMSDPTCAPDIQLWQFLTTQTPERPTTEQRILILAAFAYLPRTVHDLIGPELAAQFVSVGDTGAALEIRESLARGGRLPARDLAFLAHDIDVTATPNVRAAPETAPANAGSVRASEALALQLSTQIRQQGRASRQDLLAAEALINETDASLELGGLRHVAALGYAIAGDIEAVLMHLYQPHMDDAQTVGLIFADIIETLMEFEQTLPLVLLLNAEEFGQFGHFPTPSFRRRVAEFVLDRGMPAFARDIIRAGGGDHANDRALLERAQARLSRDETWPEIVNIEGASAAGPVQPAESLAEISGLLTQSRANRAAILEMLDQGP